MSASGSSVVLGLADSSCLSTLAAAFAPASTFCADPEAKTFDAEVFFSNCVNNGCFLLKLPFYIVYSRKTLGQLSHTTENEADIA